MPLFRLSFHFSLAGMLAICAVLQTQSQPLRERSMQDPTTQGPSSAARNDTFDQATRLMQQGKNDEALALLEGLTAAEPARRGVLRQIGIVNYRKGDFLKAAATFKKAVDEDP